LDLRFLARGAASAERARRRMELRGITPNGYPLWNTFEHGAMLMYHPNYALVVAVLKRRTLPASRSKAWRMRLTKPRARLWSDNEILRLRRVYLMGTREEILAAFPGRSYAAIARAANARGIFRKPRPIPPTGNVLLDQILSRARTKHFTRADLDAHCQSDGYFSNRKWSRGAFSHIYHARAVRELGGTFAIKWVS